jgi:tRNA A-37 threonylcarbamoyl transferase component Bud32
MGVVYKARHLKLNRVVALKMILAGSRAGPHELARFRTEGEAVARLQHPNIVQIYEVGELDGLPYFSLEFIAGGSLASRSQGKPQPARAAAAIVEQIAVGVQAAHAAGIIHRDLKPLNVLMTADDTPKVTDFGLAKKLDEDSGQTASGAIMGTPSYMSPEQAAGQSKEIGPAADVYGLGAILYELLVGHPPFKGNSMLDTLEQVRPRDPVPPRQLQSKLPRDLETICLKCLQKKPQWRYASAADLAGDLKRFLDGEPVRARPPHWWGQLARWTAREPWAALGIACGMFVVLGIAAIQPLAIGLIALWVVLTALLARAHRPIVLGTVAVSLGVTAWAYLSRPAYFSENSDRVIAFLIATWTSVFYILISRGAVWYFGGSVNSALRWAFAGTFAGLAFGVLSIMPVAVVFHDQPGGTRSPLFTWFFGVWWGPGWCQALSVAPSSVPAVKQSRAVRLLRGRHHDRRRKGFWTGEAYGEDFVPRRWLPELPSAFR